MLKRSGEREPFDRAKVVAGVQAAVKARPVGRRRGRGPGRRRGGRVAPSPGAEVTSEQVGRAVLERLGARRGRRHALRSVYKDFDDAVRLRAGAHHARRSTRAAQGAPTQAPSRGSPRRSGDVAQRRWSGGRDQPAGVEVVPSSASTWASVRRAVDGHAVGDRRSPRCRQRRDRDAQLVDAPGRQQLAVAGGGPPSMSTMPAPGHRAGPGRRPVDPIPSRPARRRHRVGLVAGPGPCARGHDDGGRRRFANSASHPVRSASAVTTAMRGPGPGRGRPVALGRARAGAEPRVHGGEPARSSARPPQHVEDGRGRRRCPARRPPRRAAVAPSTLAIMFDEHPGALGAGPALGIGVGLGRRRASVGTAPGWIRPSTRSSMAARTVVRPADASWPVRRCGQDGRYSTPQFTGCSSSHPQDRVPRLPDVHRGSGAQTRRNGGCRFRVCGGLSDS